MKIVSFCVYDHKEKVCLLLNAPRVHLLILKGPLSTYDMSDALEGTKDTEMTVSSSCPGVICSPPERQTYWQTLAIGVRTFKTLYLIFVSSD